MAVLRNLLHKNIRKSEIFALKNLILVDQAIQAESLNEHHLDVGFLVLFKIYFFK